MNATVLPFVSIDHGSRAVAQCPDQTPSRARTHAIVCPRAHLSTRPPPPPPFQQTIVPSLQIVALDKLAFDFFEDDDGTYVHPVHALGTPTQGKRRGGGCIYVEWPTHGVV